MTRPKALRLSCFNTQPPEGGWPFYFSARDVNGGFNTQPPEGGWQARLNIRFARHRFNTQPPEGGWAKQSADCASCPKFQHTAARRRLASI